MKKRTIIILSILVLGAVIYFFYFRPGRESQTISFVTGTAQYGYIAKSVTATGTVQPVDTVSVGAQVSGVVKNVYADFNDVVKQGQLLAKVDPSIINAQMEQTKATLANAQSNLEYQQNNFDRQNQLYNLGAISKADYQVALNQYNVAKASVANATAQLKLVQRNLYYTNIYSPINGVVLNRNVSEGQTIASSFNAPTLFVIAKDLTKMQVRAAVDEADIGGVRSGQHVTFTVDAFPDDIFQGDVEQILLHPSVSANVVTYTTLINVDNKAMKLKPGMTASINIYIQEDSNALLIPSRAINFKPDTALLKKYIIKRAERNVPGITKTNKNISQKDSSAKSSQGKEDFKRSFVWVRNGDTLTEKKILTGMTDDSYVKVVKGLSADDEVITSVVVGANNNTSDNTQRSPFMPQMRRRTTTTSSGQRN
ncbi:MAG TPA: efflux RND transporter periplasmic adaptor subunit [Chitinophagaceae bacterium]|nr:efflux RND transporter periplasmic adaptor subunit [Chitinophagaceae bacterium]